MQHCPAIRQAQPAQERPPPESPCPIHLTSTQRRFELIHVYGNGGSNNPDRIVPIQNPIPQLPPNQPNGLPNGMPCTIRRGPGPEELGEFFPTNSPFFQSKEDEKAQRFPQGKVQRVAVLGSYLRDAQHIQVDAHVLQGWRVWCGPSRRSDAALELIVL